MRIGVVVTPGPDLVTYAVEAERLGVATVWAPEFWAHDAFTPLAAIASRTERVRLGTAIAQLGARTPAMLAMTALGLHEVSGGRAILGIGTSGPQVMEGWHGVRFDRPLQRTRETIEIVRAICAGERLRHDGIVYQLPLPDSAGVAIRSAAPPADLPIHVASLGPANLALTGELADGWIGNSFFPETAEVFFDAIAEGARSAGRDPAAVDRSVAVSAELTDDDPAAIEAAGRRHADGYAFTFGAMGSGTRNFYNDAFARQGYGDDVAEVQRLWRSGDRAAAAARVPIEIGLGTNLIGPERVIRERLATYAACGVDELRVNPVAETLAERLAVLGRLIDLLPA